MWRIKRTYGPPQNQEENTGPVHDEEPDSDGSINNETDDSTNDVQEETTPNTQPRTRKRKPPVSIPADAINTERKTIDIRKLRPNTVYTVNFSEL